MNRIFKQLAAVLLALVLLAGTALAALPDRLIPGGQAIGLQPQTDGCFHRGAGAGQSLRAGGGPTPRRRHPRH